MLSHIGHVNDAPLSADKHFFQLHEALFQLHEVTFFSRQQVRLSVDDKHLALRLFRALTGNLMTSSGSSAVISGAGTMGAPEVTCFLQSRAVMSWCCHERC